MSSNEPLPPLTTQAENEYMEARKNLTNLVSVLGFITWLAVVPAVVIIAWKAAL